MLGCGDTVPAPEYCVRLRYGHAPVGDMDTVPGPTVLWPR